ncbi:MAG: immunoglobulin-like domain-containing protein, partial [Culicoidibacterales bacterium]
TEGKAKAFLLADGSVAAVAITNNGGYGAVAGVYTIAYAVDMEKATTKTAIATVTAGEVPVIELTPRIVSVKTNDTVDLQAGVIVHDNENKNLKATPDKSIDTTKSGVEIITYTVTDEDGNTATEVRTYIIESPTETATIGTKYVIFTTNFTKNVSEVIASNDALIEAANTRAFLLTDGSNAQVEVTDMGGYTATEGTYKIEYSVTEEQITRKVAIGTVISGEVPVITITEKMIIVNTGAVVNTIDGVFATDKEDGTISVTSDSQVDTTKTGVQIISYTATDKDGNKVTEQRTYIIESPTEKAIVGINTVIFASNFSKTVDQVIVSDEEIIIAGKAKAYFLADGKATKVEVLNTGGYKAAEGIYNIEYGITQEKTTKTAVQATVIPKGNLPIIKVKEDIVRIEIGEQIDPLEGVVGADEEDGELKVTKDKELDTSKRGVEIITYTVVDSDGNTTITKRTYVISGERDKTVLGQSYVIFAENFTKNSKDVNTESEEIIQDANAEAFSLTDQKQAAVEVADTGKYGPVDGKYVIRFQIIAEPTTVIEIEATVQDEKIIVENKELTYIKNTAKTENGFIMDAKITLINATDLKTNFDQTVDMTKVGSYIVEVTATGNSSQQVATAGKNSDKTQTVIAGGVVIVNVIESNNQPENKPQTPEKELPKTGQSTTETSMLMATTLGIASSLILLGKKLRRK